MRVSSFFNVLKQPERAWLAGILVIATVVRLIFVVLIDPQPTYSGMGDVHWYFNYGQRLIIGTAPPLSPGPVFLIYAGGIQQLVSPGRFDPDPAVAIVRLLNVVWHGVLICAIYALGRRYFDGRVARWTALALALHPAFIIESGQPLTESVFLGLFFGTLALYAYYQDHPTRRKMLLIGLLLGTATLTRAVVLLFPLVLAVQLVRLHGWRVGLRLSAALFLTFSLTLSTWTIYNLFRWERFVVGAEGLVSFAWMGAYGQKSPQEVDSMLAERPEDLQDENNQDARAGLFLRQFVEKMVNELPAYLRTRFTNLAEAYLQPHNTTYFPGESIKDAVGQWLRDDRTLAGLAQVTQREYFWQKFVLYLFHFPILLLGFAGMIWQRRRFWLLAPLYGYVLYTTAVHTVLFALPRYIFPITPILILFSVALLYAAAAARRPTATLDKVYAP